MSAITTHVLDTSLGRPATGVAVALETLSSDGEWVLLGSSITDQDGRCRDLLPAGASPSLGTYRLTFDTASYHQSNGVDGFFPEVTITFKLADKAHYHVPLLLSPYGYSTYRGS